jgi:translation initiation factor 1 (eIF-1/SUI1)
MKAALRKLEAMAKNDTKKNKVAVPEAGQGATLKHSPFGLLREAAAQAEPQPTPESTAPSTREPSAESQKSRGRLVLRRETKRRGGKAVVVVAGLRAHAHLPESEIAAIAQQLKQQLGCGGTVERVSGDTEIVVQGDQPARVAELLRARGFRVDGVTS